MNRDRLCELFKEEGYAARIYEGQLFVTACGREVLVNLDDENRDYIQLVYSLLVDLPRRVTYSRLANIANGLQHKVKLCKFSYMFKYAGKAVFAVDVDLLADEDALREKLPQYFQELFLGAEQLENAVKYRVFKD